MARADLITVGPGSLFTSLIPNLLVPGIAQAMVNSAAVKVYVGNLMTQANESLGLTAADHIRASIVMPGSNASSTSPSSIALPRHLP